MEWAILGAVLWDHFLWILTLGSAGLSTGVIVALVRGV